MPKSLVASIWTSLRKDAESTVRKDPFVAKILEESVLVPSSFSEALAGTLARRIGGDWISADDLRALLVHEFNSQVQLVEAAAVDLQAVLDRDAACNSLLEPFLFFKGFQSLQVHRVAHALWKSHRRLAALALQSQVSRALGVDIHPAAQIGYGILMDHATNVVIGETAIIGNYVSILHGVSLGGNGKEKGDRHPKVGDGVMIGAHAQLLGNIRIGKGAKIGAGAVVLENVPPHTTYAGVPAEKVGRTAESMPSLEMNQDFTTDSPKN